MPKVRHLAAIGVLVAEAMVLGQTGDASKILADAREALGGEQKLSAVKTVTVTGRLQRTSTSGRTTESEFELAIELPDKYMRRDVAMAMGNMSIYRTSGFNGDGLISEVDTPPQLAGGGNVVFRVAGAGGMGPGGAPLTPEQQAAARANQLLNAKQDFTRLALGMFAQSFPVYPLQLTYAGQAESPDGKADIIDMKGEGDFAARLFVDTQTHLPLMLSWMAKEPLTIINRGGGPDGTTIITGGRGRGDAVQGRPGGNMTPEEREKLQKQVEEQIKEAEAKRKIVEYRLFYSDYKSVDGVKIPHKFQRSVDGKPTEEVTYERVRLNQKIDASKFQVSK